MQGISNIQQTCYPKLFADLGDPLTTSNIVSDLKQVPTDLSFRVLLNELSNLSAPVIISGNIVSDAYLMDDSLSDKQFQHELYGVIE